MKVEDKLFSDNSCLVKTNEINQSKTEKKEKKRNEKIKSEIKEN